MNKDDYVAWRNNPITDEFLEAILVELDGVIADLAISAGTNSLVDRYRCGVIQGLKFLADWHPTFDFDREEKETEEDES